MQSKYLMKYNLILSLSASLETLKSIVMNYEHYFSHPLALNIIEITDKYQGLPTKYLYFVCVNQLLVTRKSLEVLVKSLKKF